MSTGFADKSVEKKTKGYIVVKKIKVVKRQEVNGRMGNMLFEIVEDFEVFTIVEGGYHKIVLSCELGHQAFIYNEKDKKVNGKLYKKDVWVDKMLKAKKGFLVFTPVISTAKKDGKVYINNQIQAFTEDISKKNKKKIEKAYRKAYKELEKKK
jgi:K+ transporter